MSNENKTFLINIHILEGKHYLWMNMDSAVIIKIDNKQKCTAVKHKSIAPFYNEYFVFEFLTTLENLLEKNLTISVIQVTNIWRKQKVLGSFTLDIITVWSQTDHQFYHKWAVLSAPYMDALSGPRGYLKVDIIITAKGQVPKLPTNEENDEIEGNLLLPEGVYKERQKASFIFDIFKCTNLVSKSMSSKSSTYVQIQFAGITKKTLVVKNLSDPVFDERVTIFEPLPPLCQLIKFQIYQGDLLHSLRSINLRLISNDNVEGFMPTFGPAYLHLYGTNLEGYIGSLLLSINAELHQELNIPVSKTITPLNEHDFCEYEDVFLMCIIYEATAITQKFSNKPISFKLTFGNMSLINKDNNDSIEINSTVPKKPESINKNYNSINFRKEKPCLRISTTMPDFRKRIYNLNMLTKIVNEMRSLINLIEKMIIEESYHSNSNDINTLLVKTIDYVASSSKIYIDIVGNYTFNHATKLDNERLKMCLKEMNNNIKICEDIDTTNKKHLFRKIQKMYGRIEHLAQDEQDNWPDIFLWMYSETKKVAYIRIPARDVIYSVVEEEMGPYCGVLRTVFLCTKPKIFENQIPCKMEMMMWLGLKRHKNECFKNIINGFSYEERVLESGFIFAKEEHNFQCRSHIYQARIDPGSDTSGLSDPFVEIIISNQSKETQIHKATLNPIWDETLIIKNITLYGTKAHIRSFPPVILAELFDRDALMKNDFIGRSELKPVIKFSDEPYKKPNFPPKLSWNKMYNKNGCAAELLAAVELLEVSDKIIDIKENLKEGPIVKIPADIKPKLETYRMEVVFWGVRNLKKVNLFQINNPRISLFCGDSVLNSEILLNATKNLNFVNPVKTLDVSLPSPIQYAPPILIKMFDSRSFGVFVYSGVYISQIKPFLYYPMTRDERNLKQLLEFQNTSIHSGIGISNSKDSTDSSEIIGLSAKAVEKTTVIRKLKNIWIKLCTKENIENCKKMFNKEKNASVKCKCSICVKKFCKKTRNKKWPASNVKEYVDDEYSDWWTKFFASIADADEIQDQSIESKHKLKVYQSELEFQPEFKGFTDMLTTFETYKGKRTGDETVDEENITAVFKGALKIYRWPPVDDLDYVTASGLSVKDGVFQDFPSNDPLRYVLRVYCVRAIGLRPKDLSGKSDPYLCLTLNDIIINDKENCVKRQVNPIFGRCFEFNATFPKDHTLTVAVWDWDISTSDDFIGQTKIDLENRFYTKYRASCGIAEKYEEKGYCEWRDPQKPVAILENLCRKYKLELPVYEETSVLVGSKQFVMQSFQPSEDANLNKQVLALNALKCWREMPVVGFPLVPENVETRSLYDPSKPGIEQGKLQMWIDILPCTDLPPPKIVNIVQREPKSYELRVIIWNTEEVVLTEDDFFVGEKKSDIYVIGWLTDSDDTQQTDVHYRSLSGEGNFNWRFIFPFNYLVTENKVVVRKKESVFAWDETDLKHPCKLTLQVWDNDTFSTDEFLGTLNLELSRLPRGAKSAEQCNISIVEHNAPTINLFRIRRTKAWWPFKAFDPDKNIHILTGKVEAEFEILTKEEAEKYPAGLGRNEPQKLPEPKRPDTSFVWFKNPLQVMKFVVCKLHRWKIIKAFLFILVIFFILAVIYAFPGYTVKRFLGA